MAKVIWKQAAKDSPIYTGRFIISSPNKRPPVTSDKTDDQTTTVKKEEEKNIDVLGRMYFVAMMHPS